MTGAERRAGALLRAAALAALFLAAPAAGDAEECVDCHDLARIGGGDGSVHPPFAEGDCGACHADHGDRERLELVEEGVALCAQCHEPADEAFRGTHRGIAATGKASCTGCHDPHRAAAARLVRPGLHKPVADRACEGCHRSDGKLKIPLHLGFCHLCHAKGPFTRPVVHDPVAKARCLDCHDPHGSPRRALLPAGYAPEREGAGADAEWGVCLRCHDGGAFRGSAGAATRFADRERGNLHALHVLPPGAKGEERAATRRGLSCRNCHEVHSAPRPALTRTELECGPSLCLKLEFQPAPEGGSCLASCHGERVRYVRP